LNDEKVTMVTTVKGQQDGYSTRQLQLAALVQHIKKLYVSQKQTNIKI